ncbi:hypothetical protein [Malaciobacter marinus]|uniref:hypothetical protein n=1 Tax=Malaciobacter marinus TaxID=505249 RepID=UPI0009A67378|nr:hypothetical protein [Malaciobacter marinus]SKB73885.1 hypothetical protein SAMN06295997_13722 [Malaciobacter marinus]
MSFKNGYYKKLCDNYLELLKPINKDKRFCDEELLKRDFVSRSYYTALLHCRDKIPESLLENQDGGTHQKIINSIKNDYIEEDLRSLKRLRVQADYNTNTFPTPLKVKSATYHLNRIDAIIKDILSKTKDDLIPE